MTPYYETKNGKLYHGDCLEIMPELEPVDLILTDPPYGIGEHGGKCRTRGSAVPNHPDMGWDNIIPDKAVFDIILEISNNQIIFGGNYFSHILPQSRCWFYWRKLMGGDFADGELIWTSFDAVVKEITKPNKGLKTEHPTQKPVAVMVWCLQMADKKADIVTVLDPFVGSGTTPIACERLNRHWIGIEISEEYCEIAAKRIERETSQQRLPGGF